MSKSGYIGVSSKAKKIKKMYIGVSGKARKVKKAYIGGSDGKARCFYVSETAPPTYYGYLSDLYLYSRFYLTSVSLGDYAIFAYGRYRTSNMNYADYYSSTLTHTHAQLSIWRYILPGVNIQNTIAIFAGGDVASSTTGTDEITTLNTSLTETHPTTKLRDRRFALSGASIGNYAIFSGGYGGDSCSQLLTADAINSSITRTSLDNTADTRMYGSATTVGNYVVIAGGSNTTSYSTIVDAYSSSLTHTTAAQGLYAESAMGCSTTIGNYAIFMPHGNNNGSAYNSSLTRSPVVFDYPRRAASAVTYGDYAIFGPGYKSDPTYYTTTYLSNVDFVNASLTRTRGENIGTYRDRYGLAKAGRYIIFAGGYSNTVSNDIPSVEAYVGAEL